MLFRMLAYILFGWLLLAAVPALGFYFGLTVMLPATSAVLLTHLAFTRKGSFAWLLTVAMTLGYLEDLHQGAPLGVLTLAHGCAMMILRWAAVRVSLQGVFSRAVAALLTIVVIDLITWGSLMLLADSFGMASDSLMRSLPEAKWHVLATALVADPVWRGMDALLRVLHIDEVRPGETGEHGVRPAVIGK